MPDTQSIVIIGFGYSANATARAVSDAGWQVTGTTRNEGVARHIESEGHTALVVDPAESTGAARLRDTVKQVDAVLVSVPPGEAGDPVLGALEDMDLSGKRLIYLSTTGVYGDRHGGWAFEWDPVTPGQTRSKRRAEAEASWLAKGAVSFRLGGIYGPGRSALDRLQSGNRVIDKPGQVFSRIHVDDIGQGVVKALQRTEVTGPINLVDDEPTSQAEHMTAVADLAGMPRPEILAYDEAELSPMAASFFAECRRVSNARAKAALGWTPRYRTALEGVKAMLG